MKKFKIITWAISLFAVILFLGSCIPEGEDSVGEAGSTLVKFLPGDFSLVALNATATPQTSALFQIRRDVKSESALNKPASVTLQFDTDTTMLEAYNQRLVDEWMAADTSRHDPADYDGPVFIEFPRDWYTTDPPIGADGSLTLNFAAGEFSKAIMITVPDASIFDFSAAYGLSFQLVSVSGEGVKSLGTNEFITCQVMAKNKWDGKYEVQDLADTDDPDYVFDAVNASFHGFYPFTYNLETTGANTCICIDMTVWYDAMHPMLNGTATSGYGSFGLEVEFDDDGNIIAVYNPWGNPPANTRMPVIDPSGVNKWDPVTGDIQFKYWMIQPSLVPDPPHIRVFFDEYWKYKGSR